jgi:two-component sensor histidine kinase
MVKRFFTRWLVSPASNSFASACLRWVTFTSRPAATKEDMVYELTSRLMALGRAQDLIRPVLGRNSEVTLLGDLVSVLLAPYDEKGASVRIRVSVPKMNVGEKSSTTLALVIHELATNSAKYGSLSIASGTLDVRAMPMATKS